MVEVVWSARSLKDIEEIGEYISRDSARYAKLTLEKLIDSAELIKNNALIGRVVPEIKQKDIREIIMGNYRIIYQTRDKGYAFVLTVHHSSKLFPNKFLKKRK